MFKVVHYSYLMYLKYLMCLEIYELDPAKFISAPELSRQVYLKKTKLKLGILNDIDM